MREDLVFNQSIINFFGCSPNYDAIDDDFDQYDQHANFITFIQIYQFMDYEKEKWYFYCGCLPSLGIPTPLKRIQGTNQSSGSRLCVSTPRAWRRSLPWNEKQVSNFFSPGWQEIIFCSLYNLPVIVLKY